MTCTPLTGRSDLFVFLAGASIGAMISALVCLVYTPSSNYLFEMQGGGVLTTFLYTLFSGDLIRHLKMSNRSVTSIFFPLIIICGFGMAVNFVITMPLLFVATLIYDPLNKLTSSFLFGGSVFLGVYFLVRYKGS